MTNTRYVFKTDTFSLTFALAAFAIGALMFIISAAAAANGVAIY